MNRPSQWLFEAPFVNLTPSPVSNKPMLRRGSRGATVVELQNLLTQKGFRLPPDGIFGSYTDAAVRSFQRSRGLGVDGIVGSNTWAALLSGSRPPVASPRPTYPPYPIRTLGNVEQQLRSQIAAGKIIFDNNSDTLRGMLFKGNSGTKVTDKLQKLVLGLSELVNPIRISSLVRFGSTNSSNHDFGRAVDVANEEIARDLLPRIATEAKVAELEVDELIFDGNKIGEPRNKFNFKYGRRYEYSEKTLYEHRDHIHISVKA
ncbi:MAG: peptidoglycan-binding protein [Phormidesmis sp. CAN_BIN44]|nr:peptidoglycan-binding protein [Phormidesmis sp. CAN_BIN44]